MAKRKFNGAYGWLSLHSRSWLAIAHNFVINNCCNAFNGLFGVAFLIMNQPDNNLFKKGCRM